MSFCSNLDDVIVMAVEPEVGPVVGLTLDIVRERLQGGVRGG